MTTRSTGQSCTEQVVAAGGYEPVAVERRRRRSTRSPRPPRAGQPVRARPARHEHAGWTASRSRGRVAKPGIGGRDGHDARDRPAVAATRRVVATRHGRLPDEAGEGPQSVREKVPACWNIREFTLPSPPVAAAGGRPPRVAVPRASGSSWRRTTWSTNGWPARCSRSAGHEVTVHGQRARGRLKRFPAVTTISVLMDVQMPEMDGFEATAAIRAAERTTGRHIRILAMTAHAMSGDAQRCLEQGIGDYIASRSVRRGCPR